jgi:hypothetical protein
MQNTWRPSTASSEQTLQRSCNKNSSAGADTRAGWPSRGRPVQTETPRPHPQRAPLRACLPKGAGGGAPCSPRPVQQLCNAAPIDVQPPRGNTRPPRWPVLSNHVTAARPCPALPCSQPAGTVHRTAPSCPLHHSRGSQVAVEHQRWEGVQLQAFGGACVAFCHPELSPVLLQGDVSPHGKAMPSPCQRSAYAHVPASHRRPSAT